MTTKATHAPEALPAVGAQPEPGVGRERAGLCECKARPASECAETWGPACDMGNNPAHAVAVPGSEPTCHYCGKPGAGWTAQQLARGKRMDASGLQYHCKTAYYLD